MVDILGIIPIAHGNPVILQMSQNLCHPPTKEQMLPLLHKPLIFVCSNVKMCSLPFTMLTYFLPNYANVPQKTSETIDVSDQRLTLAHSGQPVGAMNATTSCLCSFLEIIIKRLLACSNPKVDTDILISQHKQLFFNDMSRFLESYPCVEYYHVT